MPGVCPRCDREVYFAEEKLALGKVWHTFCFSCRNCRKLLNSYSVVTHLGELFCKNCYVRLSLSAGNHEVKTAPDSSAAVAFPTQDSSNCNRRGVEGSIGNASLSGKQHYQPDKCRLRGGGSDAGETKISLDVQEKHFLENECANLAAVNSTTTVCDPPPSPTAITTWYNRQHSKFRSALSVESQCRFAAQYQETDQTGLTPTLSNNEINVAETKLSADETRATSTNGTDKINRHGPVCEFSRRSDTIPSRRKFTYPPIPPPRSPLPYRRRVSFCDVVLGDTRENERACASDMQDARRRACCNNDSDKDRYSSYDIWRADDPAAGRNDGGYETVHVNPEGIGRMHYARSVSDCCDAGEDASSKCNDIESNCNESNLDARAYRTMNEKDDGSGKEDTLPTVQQNGRSCEFDDNERMRGGCGGPCGSRPKCGTIKVIETPCCCMKREPDPCRTIVTSCPACASPCVDRRGSCPPPNERPVCKKPIIRCRQPCAPEPQACGGGGCCGSGCRGGCGKPGQTCMPARPCTIPPCRPCSPCSPPRPCPSQPSCCCSRKCGSCCGGGGGSSCCRSKSPVCRLSRTRRCCSTDRAESSDGGCCRPKVGCECLGGGPDCQRCGRKVYQAEMQTVSGIPYHQICFSCFCCRKPLEPLTYQENCGEIYCKQCYVRNFGPQGYGYGAGPGTLQTPM